jgi:hypothetical protein
VCSGSTTQAKWTRAASGGNESILWLTEGPFVKSPVALAVTEGLARDLPQRSLVQFHVTQIPGCGLRSCSKRVRGALPLRKKVELLKSLFFTQPLPPLVCRTVCDSELDALFSYCFLLVQQSTDGWPSLNCCRYLSLHCTTTPTTKSESCLTHIPFRLYFPSLTIVYGGRRSHSNLISPPLFWR